MTITHLNLKLTCCITSPIKTMHAKMQIPVSSSCKQAVHEILPLGMQHVIKTSIFLVCIQGTSLVAVYGKESCKRYKADLSRRAWIIYCTCMTSHFRLACCHLLQDKEVLVIGPQNPEAFIYVQGVPSATVLQFLHSRKLMHTLHVQFAVAKVRRGVSRLFTWCRKLLKARDFACVVWSISIQNFLVGRSLEGSRRHESTIGDVSGLLANYRRLHLRASVTFCHLKGPASTCMYWKVTSMRSGLDCL